MWHRDGTFATGHDLAAERIACALGGYLTCITLVDDVFPALEALVALRWRTEPPPITATAAGRWESLDQPDGCVCAGTAYRSGLEASQHVRSVEYWARFFGCERRTLETVSSAVFEAYGSPGDDQFAPDVTWRVDDYLTEFRALDLLWRWGWGSVRGRACAGSKPVGWPSSTSWGN